jgi:hypothetical protein
MHPPAAISSWLAPPPDHHIFLITIRCFDEGFVPRLAVITILDTFLQHGLFHTSAGITFNFSVLRSHKWQSDLPDSTAKKMKMVEIVAKWDGGASWEWLASSGATSGKRHWSMKSGYHCCSCYNARNSVSNPASLLLHLLACWGRIE